ncbi:MAG TPA: SDR family oxidoreductase [Anaerolineales bacterium]
MDKLTGKSVLVTGATNGIGKVTAFELARKGASVSIVGQDPRKTDRVVTQIKGDSGNPAVEGLVADLSSMTQVRQLAQEYRQKHASLHILINNAGAIFANRLVTVDGYERTFALNHLAYYVLTNLLLDVLISNTPARIINVSSRAHEGATMNFDDLQCAQHYGYGGYRAYGQSKLANLLFTHELGRRLNGTGVTVNALHPGTVATGFGENNGAPMKLSMRIFHQFSLTPEQGADTIIYLASSPEVEGITGKYWMKRKAVPSSPESYDEDAQKRLWSISAQLTGLPEIVQA